MERQISKILESKIGRRFSKLSLTRKCVSATVTDGDYSTPTGHLHYNYSSHRQSAPVTLRHSTIISCEERKKPSHTALFV